MDQLLKTIEYTTKNNNTNNIDISFKILKGYFITIRYNHIYLYDFKRNIVTRNIYNNDINKLLDDLKKYKGVFIDNKIRNVISYYIIDHKTNLDQYKKV